VTYARNIGGQGSPGNEAARFSRAQEVGPKRFNGNGRVYSSAARRAQPRQEKPVDIADLRFRRQVDRLHRLGPRVLYEFLAELGSDRLIRTELELRVERYAALDPEILRATGGDSLPPGATALVRDRWPRA
jgi:hypothetical protein